MKHTLNSIGCRRVLYSCVVALLAAAPIAPCTAAQSTNASPPFEWKHADWKDPDKILPEFRCDGLPLGEVARLLRQQFTNYFDTLMPQSCPISSGSEADNSTALPQSMDVASLQISLRLKDVTASEVFNAMNLKFELDKIPLCWELLMNGRRPTAVLRVLDLPKPQSNEPPQKKKDRAVFYVGDLLGDPQKGGMTFQDVIKTVQEVVADTVHTPTLQLSVHKAAQILVVTGSKDELGLVQDTLAALKQKAEHEADVRTSENPPGQLPPKTP